MQCPSAEQIVALVNNELPGPQRAAIASHVDDCADCRRTLEAIKLTISDSNAPTEIHAPQNSVAETVVYAHASGEPPDATQSSSGSIKLSIPGFDLLSELGRGGMGVVYKARQKSLERLVALKMIRSAALAGADQIARFNTEAASLAQIQHPNIVQVFEIGWHDDMPYLSMEFVQGPTLRQTLDERSLSYKEAARLVEKLARAMFSAHQRGILHRDLKPSNILLDAGGEPKITDFGLAKRVTAESHLTASDAVMGTPSYMPPEQAQGLIAQVGPRSDIYSLGAILYEILTNRPPFRAATPLETIQQVIQREPQSPKSLNPRVPRDLETICLKCLQKAQTQRYETAADLADDLRRFDRDEPIMARRIGWTERSWRWCLRNRALSAAMAVTVLAVVLGAAGYGWKAHQAARNQHLAEQQFGRFVAESQEKLQLIQDLMERIPDDQRAQDQRLQSALASYETWLVEEPDDPAARRAYSQALFRVAEIRRKIGQFQQAEVIYLKARDHFQQLVDDAAADQQLRHELAETLNYLGENYRERGQLLEAIAAYDESMRHLEVLRRGAPHDLQHQADIGRSLYNRALARRDLNQLPAAEEDLRTSIELLQNCLQGSGESAAARQHLARSQINLGILLRGTDRPQEAHQQNVAAITLLQTLHEEFPDEPDYQLELATVLTNQANLLLADHQQQKLNVPQPLAEAERMYQSAVDILQQLCRQYANVPRYRKALANSLNGQGAVLSQLSRSEDAHQAWSQAADELKQLVARSAGVGEYHSLLAQTTYNLAYLHRNDDDKTSLTQLIRESVDHQQRALELSPDNALYADRLRSYQRNLANQFIAAGLHAEAAEVAEQLAAHDSGDGQSQYFAAKTLASCHRLASSGTAADADAATIAASYRARLDQLLMLCRQRGVTIKAEDFPHLEITASGCHTL